MPFYYARSWLMIVTKMSGEGALYREPDKRAYGRRMRLVEPSRHAATCGFAACFFPLPAQAAQRAGH